MVSNVSNLLFDFHFLFHIHYQKGRKNQSGLKNLKPNINLNQDVYMLILLLADNFALVFHSLDIWHKSKSIRKCLTKVCKIYNYLQTLGVNTRCNVNVNVEVEQGRK